MLATRASAIRNVQRISRSFATVANPTGVNVAAVDYNQPTSSVTVLVKAGSRYETKKGVANALKNFAFKSTSKRSALGTVRESDLYGGVLSASLSREYLALTAEFLRGDEEFFVDVLSSYISSAKFTRHEFEEYVVSIMEGEAEAANADPATHAIELAHTLAFRSGLGSSIFPPSHNSITVADVKSFASAAFSKGNVAVIGTGINPTTLNKLVETSFSTLPASTPLSTTATSYFGGESRIQHHGGPQTVFIGFGSSGSTPELAVLSAHLSTKPSVKWSQGLSPIVSSLTQGTSVQPVHLQYSDASLFGLLVQGQTAASVKEAGKSAVQALKTAAQGIKDEEFKKSVAKAKFNIANTLEHREGLVSILGSKIFAGSTISADAAVSSLDNVSAATFSKAISSLISTKPTFVAVGDVQSLPYADEVSL